ncbi:carbohydrate ABC transporter permease [Anaerobium acetethylicum]|uniref:Putative aldouronate transport system permease protein n=1 Tax=Anaerobium acetethylicum TaxID=1619234 RepID=A0A1D3TWD8_9FIRM|nr:carbohydrate ABC transporter permease [Anaerobium acetethylicum]SCP98534.1 putative aldouronate transport system permease protein [Anaerobium acetethylicum]
MESGVKGANEKVFQTIITAFLFILALLAILPFMLLISSSLTEEKSLLSEGYNFITTHFSAYAYKYLFLSNGAKIFRSYGITFFITVAGTAVSLIIGPLLAYPMSRADYPRRKIVTLLVVFTMLFNGGVVPSYLMWTQIFHLKNTIWALVFPNLLFNGFYIILYKNNFKANIHPALIEAAKIDGAGEFFIYRKIVLPLSTPILATIGLMVGLGYWNDWTNGLYYISDNRLYSLQLLLNSIINNISALATMSTSATLGQSDMPGTGIRMAMAVIGVIPIIILYPFFQKYFIKGIAIGGVKE